MADPNKPIAGHFLGTVVLEQAQTLTGSIGVISEFITAEDLMNEVGISVDTIKSGSVKDFGSPYREMTEDELFVAAKELQAPYDLVKDVAEHGKLPVVNFVAGGISTPADAALVMQLGSEGVFVGSGIFKSEDPARMANAIVQATTHFDDPKILAEVSKGLGAPMRGLALEQIPDSERLAVRGW